MGYVREGDCVDMPDETEARKAQSMAHLSERTGTGLINVSHQEFFYSRDEK